MKISRMRVLIPVSIVLGVMALIIALMTSTSCVAYACLNFPEKNLWKLKEVYEETDKVWRGLLVHPEYQVRLERIGNVDETDAHEFTKIRAMTLSGLFAKARSPYPGAVSDEIECQDAYKPVVENFILSNGTEITMLSAYMNDRLQYGSCIEDQIAYKGYVVMLYCKKIRQWYQIELMVPKGEGKSDDEYRNLFKGIGC